MFSKLHFLALKLELNGKSASDIMKGRFCLSVALLALTEGKTKAAS
jgi:hypothetical protein